MKNIINIRPLDVGNQFKNRERRIEEINNYLCDFSTRIICITGRGGIGKTALVSKILEAFEKKIKIPGQNAQEDAGFDGVLYLTSQSTTLTLERIYNDIAKMLGEPAASLLSKRWKDRGISLLSKVDYLLELMQGGRYIILLDNFESYLDDDNNINNTGLSVFLERCLLVPFQSKILITSRGAIKNIAPPYSNIIQINLNEGLPPGDTIKLIRELDRQNILGSEHADEEDLLYIANLTLGIPRAVEIIIGIIQNDPFINFLNIIEENKSYRDAIVEQLYAKGFHLLSQDDQKILEVLAVLNKPSGNAAISFMLSPWYPHINVKQNLKSLILKKFTLYNRASQKFSLHPLDQYYSYKNITIEDEANSYNLFSLERRAADYYAGIQKPREDCQNFDDIIPNLLEFQHRINGKDFNGAFHTLELIVRSHLLKWGYTNLIIEYVNQLLENLTEKKYIAVSLGNLGSAQYAIGNVQEAIQLLNNAFDLMKDVEQQKAGEWLADLGVAYYTLGEFDYAGEIFSKALELARKTGDKNNEAGRLGHLALIERNLGRNLKAMDLYKKALQISREINNKELEGIQLGSLGTVYLETGDLSTAKAHYEAALAIAIAVKDKRREDVWLGHLGMVYSYLNETDKALQYFNDALIICDEIGDIRHEVNWRYNLGRIFFRQNNLDKALELFLSALEKSERIGYYRMKSSINLSIGKLLILKNDIENSLLHLTKATSFKLQLIDVQADLFISIAQIRTGSIVNHDKIRQLVAACQIALKIEKDLFAPGFITAFAMTIDAVTHNNWYKKEQRDKLLAPALSQYQDSLKICNAPGIILDILNDLAILETAGIEGLDSFKKVLINSKLAHTKE